MAKWIKRIIWIIALAAVVALVVVAMLPKPTPVDVMAVSRGPLVVTVDEDGKTRVKDRHVVSAPLFGNLSRIELRPGDEVTTGGLVARIVPVDPPLIDTRARAELSGRALSAEAAKRQVEAGLERAKATQAFSASELERVRKLASSGAVSPRELEVAELEAKSRQKELESSEFALRMARYEVEMTRAALVQPGRGKDEKKAAPGFEIKSPITGKVLRVLVESEGVVAVGTPLIEIADSGALEVVADVVTTEAVAIKPGAKVMIERWGGGNPLSGRVRSIEPSAFTKLSALGVEEQRVNVVIDIESPRGEWSALGDGYRVDVKVITFEAPDALLVPAAALFRDGAGFAVFVIEQGKAKKRAITLGRRSGISAMVEEGLSEGERVIVHPSDTIAEGKLVIPR